MAPDEPPDPIAVALAIARILDDLEIRYLIGGSLASSVHGEPRSTNDVDFVADLRTEHVEPFLAALGREYYASEDAVRAAIEDSSSFNLIHMTSAVKVDVFLAGQDPFNAERLRCRQTVQVS